METYELVFQLIKMSLEFINPKEKEIALFTILDFIYNEDVCDLNELKDYANSEEEDWIYKKVNSYMKENGLDDEEDEDNMDW